MNTYTITGGSFRLDDGTVKQAGDTIELEDDVAQLHTHNLQPHAPAEQSAEHPGHE